MEHLVGGDDDQHVQAPAHERLRGDEAHEEPRARDLPDRPEPLPDLDAGSLRSEATRPGTETRASRTADASSVAALAAKTAATSANATSTPAASGPSRVPRLSIVEVAPFAAISSRAVRASDGSSATSAGRNSVEQTPTADAGGEDDDPVVHQRAHGRDDERSRSQEHDAQQEPLAPEAIAEGRGERRDRRPPGAGA